jgi:hypothetical protein
LPHIIAWMGPGVCRDGWLWLPAQADPAYMANLCASHQLEDKRFCHEEAKPEVAKPEAATPPSNTSPTTTSRTQAARAAMSNHWLPLIAPIGTASLPASGAGSIWMRAIWLAVTQQMQTNGSCGHTRAWT